jgi:hypothetical protein
MIHFAKKRKKGSTNKIDPEYKNVVLYYLPKLNPRVIENLDPVVV